jgi:CubicO group peptidase (beta-lactamase class C family)
MTYRVGSIIKQFTALPLLQLIEQHQMRLTDPLEKYVPEVKQVKSPPPARSSNS